MRARSFISYPHLCRVCINFRAFNRAQQKRYEIRNTPQLSDSSNIVLKHMNGIISVFGRLLFLLIFARSITRRLFISIICFSSQRTSHAAVIFVENHGENQSLSRRNAYDTMIVKVATDYGWLVSRWSKSWRWNARRSRAKFAVNYRYRDHIESDNAPCNNLGLLRVCRVFNIHIPDLIYRRYRRETLPKANIPRDKENDKTPEWKTKIKD